MRFCVVHRAAESAEDDTCEVAALAAGFGAERDDGFWSCHMEEAVIVPQVGGNWRLDSLTMLARALMYKPAQLRAFDNLTGTSRRLLLERAADLLDAMSKVES